MSQQIWCEKCAAQKQPGERMVFAGFTEPYEQPPEYERVVFGRLLPRPDRIVAIGPPDDLTFHEITETLCDNCNTEIPTGARVCAHTIYSKDFPEAIGWETKYITPDIKEASV